MQRQLIISSNKAVVIDNTVTVSNMIASYDIMVNSDAVSIMKWLLLA